MGLAAPRATDGGRAGTLASRPPSGPPRPAPAEPEIERLRSVCRRRELAMDRLLEAMLLLRRGNIALREENRELRREVQLLRARRG